MKSKISKNLDEIYSDILIFNADNHTPELNFSLSQKPFSTLPPLTIKNSLDVLTNVDVKERQVNLPEREAYFFSSLEFACLAFNELEVIKCLPYFVSTKLKSEIILDLGFLGAVAILNQSVSQFQNQDSFLSSQLIPLIDYIFSQELWLPNGKWHRFQSKIKSIFESKNLLISTNSSDLGFFSLNPICKSLEKHGYLGESTSSSYDIYLPWTFSTKDLSHLEQIIIQEF